jgi:hypothetical protein
MTAVFDDIVDVDYGQIYVISDPDGFIDGFEQSRDGQVNGLCGAATPGLLYLTIGLHSGSVRFTVEVHDHAPALSSEWEEVVEASFRPITDDVSLCEWAGQASWPLPLPSADYRVRYCATGMDEADQFFDDGPGPDRYLLQFWPAPPAPDVIERQGSRSAVYWHQVARETPARGRDRGRADEERRWNGRRPDIDRLAEVEMAAVGLARLDRDLVDQIAAAEPAVQRRMAAWAARYTCEQAGVAGSAWIALGLYALEAGEPPPPWFADLEAATAHWRGLGRQHPADGLDPMIPAMHAVLTARGDDTLAAALDTVRTAIETVPERRAAAINEFRTAFGLPG